MKTNDNRPAGAAGDLYFPTDISPEELLQAIGRLRKEAQDEIDRLIAFLDSTETDSDLEPSLAGYSDGMDDREGDSADDEDGGDGEPSLASPENRYGGSQDQWARGGRNDMEEEHDGREPDEADDELDSDDEPNLGWTVDGVMAGFDDRESAAEPNIATIHCARRIKHLLAERSL